MANSFVLPGGLDTYVPTLQADLIVEFTRNPKAFPVNEFIDYRIVDKQRGYYVKMLNDLQTRIIDDTDNIWADGNDSPHWTDGTPAFTFPQYVCVRRREPARLGALGTEQAAWDLLDQTSRMLAANLMTKRVRRIYETLTTSGNWSFGFSGGSSNYATATTAGGGTWASASASNPYIRTSLAYARIQIEQATNGIVTGKDLVLLMNPNVAKTVATSQEFLAFLEQQPSAVQIWEASEQFQIYGMPDYVMGLRVIVDNTVYNSAPPQAAASVNFALSNSYAILLSKPRSVQSAASASYSTFAPFLYEDMAIEVFNDPENRRYNVYVTENIDDSSNALVAPQSGFLIKIDS
jgi:hypothetical protein